MASNLTFPNVLAAVASFVIIVAGMNAAASIINPFLLSVFLAALCSPPLFWLKRRGVPNALAVAVIVIGVLVVALLLMAFMGRSLNTLAQQLPTYQERLSGIIAQVFSWINRWGFEVDVSSLLLTDYFSPREIMSIVTHGLSIFRILFTNVFLICWNRG